MTPTPPRNVRSTLDLIDDLVMHWQVPPEILVVDDHPNVLDIMSEILKSFGCNVTRGSTAREGIEAYKRAIVGRYSEQGVTAHPFDLAFIDINLPDASGLTVLHEIRELWKAQPVIMISGNMDLREHNLTADGPVCIVEKPISRDGLKLAIAMHNLRMPGLKKDRIFATKKVSDIG